MRIGIDIDGVMTNLEQFEMDYGIKFIQETGKGKITDITQYEIKKVFNWTDKEEEIFWKKYIMEFAENKPRRFVSEIIKELRQKHEIYIITARNNNELDNMSEYVKDWLKKYDIIYDNLIFSEEDKLENCMKYKIDVMIEDKPDNIIKISNQIPVICFDARYNRNCKGKNITRCYSWHDIKEKIKNIEEEKNKCLI